MGEGLARKQVTATRKKRQERESSQCKTRPSFWGQGLDTKTRPMLEDLEGGGELFIQGNSSPGPPSRLLPCGRAVLSAAHGYLRVPSWQ